jgi:hypothetical protein
MTMVTADTAGMHWSCPVSATGASCSGSKCPVWRFAPAMTGPRFVEAVAEARKETGEHGIKCPKAAALVAENPARFGFPTGDARLGWCGLGGKPEVAS